MEILLAVTAALAVASLVIGLRPGQGDRRTRERITSLRDETQFGLPTPERSTRSALEALGDGLQRLLPPLLRERLDQMLRRAGAQTDPGRFLLGWVAVTASAALLAAMLVLPEGDSQNMGFAALIVAFIAVAPWLWMRRQARQRTKSISRALPQALDLIVTNIESGLGLQAALLTVAKKFTGPIGDEFARATAEISVGVPRDQALLAMAERTGSEDVLTVSRAIAQAERSGISIAQILRARATEMRQRRRLQAREQANKVPVKMTIPVVFFIFPTFFLLLLTPVALNAADVMGQ